MLSKFFSELPKFASKSHAKSELQGLSEWKTGMGMELCSKFFLGNELYIDYLKMSYQTISG